MPVIKHVYGHDGKDVMTGTSALEWFYLMEGGDTWTALDGGNDDRVYAGGGNDYLKGANANEALHGESGDDVIDGGAGNDWLAGGTGRDILTGGAGKDTFAFYSTMDSIPGFADVIADFQFGQDKINLSFIDANLNLAGDQAFKFIGDNDFTGTGGEVRAFQSQTSGKWFVAVDRHGDGDTLSDMTIEVTNGSLFTAADFIL